MNVAIVFMAIGATTLAMAWVYRRSLWPITNHGGRLFYHPCPSCQIVVRFKSQHLGRCGKCPSCRRLLNLPKSASGQQPQVTWHARRK